MLQYKIIDVSEGMDTNKASASKECTLYHHWYFKDVGLKLETYIAILNVKGVHFKCNLWRISRDEAVNSLNNYVLEDKGVL